MLCGQALISRADYPITLSSLDFLRCQEVKLHQERFFRSLEEMKLGVGEHEPADCFRYAFHLMFLGLQS